MTRQGKEKIIKGLFLLIAFVSILILGLIVVSLFREGLPIFREVSVTGFLFGREWYPTYEPPEYGIWPLIVGSLIVTFFSSLIAVPLGVLSAIFIAEIAPLSIREILKSAIELLAVCLPWCWDFSVW